MNDADIKRSVRVVTAPTVEPVTLAEARLWCRIDDDDTSQDAMLLLLIIAMREVAEDLTGCTFAPRVLELTMDSFPSDAIELPQGPVQSVTSISYLDGDGALQVLAGSPNEFVEDLYSVPARLSPLVGWPSTKDTPNAVRVRYTAGYATHNQIPRKLRLWMQLKIATLYENRETIVVNGQVQSLPRDLTDGLLDALRANRMFA